MDVGSQIQQLIERADVHFGYRLAEAVRAGDQEGADILRVRQQAFHRDATRLQMGDSSNSEPRIAELAKIVDEVSRPATPTTAMITVPTTSLVTLPPGVESAHLDPTGKLLVMTYSAEALKAREIALLARSARPAARAPLVARVRWNPLRAVASWLRWMFRGRAWQVGRWGERCDCQGDYCPGYPRAHRRS